MKIGDIVLLRKDGTKCIVASVTKGVWSGRIILVVIPMSNVNNFICCFEEEVDVTTCEVS